MTIAPLLHRIFAAVALLLMAPVLSYALSIYDVIQLSEKNYSDQDIVALIQATDSAFTLVAEDIVRLKELGLSEQVIQAMLKAIPDEAGINPVARNTAPPTHSPASPAHVEHTPDSSAHASSTTMVAAPAKTIAGGRFDSSPFQETRSGHHHHSTVNLAGIRLLVLRDEGLFPSVANRASTVAGRLEQAASVGEGTFHPDPEANVDSVMFYGSNTDKPMTILNVSQADALAYQRRSGRTVTPALLAAYWSDLLSDYWSIVINQSPPDRLSGLHDGEVLTALHEQWTISSETASAQLTDAAQLLPRQQQQHLRRLASTVPHDFLIRDTHLAERP